MNDIVYGAKGAFGFPILWESVRAGESKKDAMAVKEIQGNIVDKLVAIILLDGLNSETELSPDVGKKVSEDREHLRFVSQRNCPKKMCKSSRITGNTENHSYSR